jgi:uncharacterized protein (DUF2062 family)
VGPLRRYYDRARAVWDWARREHATPREIGWSVGIGVFCGCTPFYGLHMWMALGITTLFRLNRLWAFIGSRVSTNVVLYAIVFSEIELGHRLRSGAWVRMAPREVFDHARQLLGDWLIGSAIVGTGLGALLGLVAYVVATRAVSRRRLGQSPARTSGSPPSAPPAPTP